MTNAVILYMGNVGSTPLMQLAGEHAKICVPVNEEFDRYLFRKFAEENRSDALAETLAQVYRRNVPPYLAGRTLATREDAPHLLFKWRNLGYKQTDPGSAALNAVFAKHEVRPVLLARRSVVEQALKVFMTGTHYGELHPQSKTKAMSDEDHKAYLDAQADVTFRLDTDGIAKCRELAETYLGRVSRILREARSQFAWYGAPKVLISEQFLTPELDYPSVSRVLSALLEDDIAVSQTMAPKVRRAGLGIDRCSNADVVAADRGLRDIEPRYQELLRGLTPLVGHWSKPGLIARLTHKFRPPHVALSAATAPL